MFSLGTSTRCARIQQAPLGISSWFVQENEKTKNGGINPPLPAMSFGEDCVWPRSLLATCHCLPVLSNQFSAFSC